jgi:hypothetical protein
MVALSRLQALRMDLISLIERVSFIESPRKVAVFIAVLNFCQWEIALSVKGISEGISFPSYCQIVTHDPGLFWPLFQFEYRLFAITTLVIVVISCVIVKYIITTQKAYVKKKMHINQKNFKIIS